MHGAAYHYLSRDSVEELLQDIREANRTRGIRARDRGYLFQIIVLGGGAGCFKACTKWLITGTFLSDLTHRAYTTPTHSFSYDSEDQQSTTGSIATSDLR
eukprot:GHVU01100288.1.p1 GENE.GHVU01100288.1~~GHVU01100288.1.p1  ORF type:complete len:100 (-),score=7.44 GHVU01100288.1:374-673(-)